MDLEKESIGTIETLSILIDSDFGFGLPKFLGNIVVAMVQVDDGCRWFLVSLPVFGKNRLGIKVGFS